MSSTVKSPLYKARTAGRTAQVTVVLGDEYPDLVWRPRCIGCGDATTRLEPRSGSVSRVEGSARTTRTLTLSIPICEACSAKDRRSQARMIVGALAVGLVTVGLAWPRLGGGAAAIGLIAFLVASGVALALGPVQAIAIAPTMGGQLTLMFRRREAARDLVQANAADEREAKELLADLGDAAR